MQKGPSTLAPTPSHTHCHSIGSLLWRQRTQLALFWGPGNVKLTALYPWLAGVGGLAPPGWRSQQGETRAGQGVRQEQR